MGMKLLRISEASAVGPFRLRLVLSDGRAIERHVEELLVGPIFDPVRRSQEEFRRVRAVDGAVCWPNGADLCPDVLIWGGAPPKEPTEPPAVPRPWALDAAKR